MECTAESQDDCGSQPQQQRGLLFLQDAYRTSTIGSLSRHLGSISLPQELLTCNVSSVPEEVWKTSLQVPLLNNRGRPDLLVHVPPPTTNLNPSPSLLSDAEVGNNLLLLGHQDDTTLAVSRLRREEEDEGTEAFLPPSREIDGVESTSRCFHPFLTRWDSLLATCIIFLIGFFGGQVFDSLANPMDRQNYANSSQDDMTDYKTRIENIWSCAHKLSAGRGFGISAERVSSQQKAVDWFIAGPGYGIQPPRNVDLECHWQTPFGFLYALIVLRGSLAIKDHSWFSDVVVYNVSDVCSWKRVKCEDRAIVSLELNHANLTGSIPPEILGLQSLTMLKFFSNQMLVGSIPTELGQLEHLEKIYFQSTSLQGRIPSELGQLTNLDEFHLDRTLLSGVVPNRVCQLRRRKLQILSASCAGEDPLLHCDHPACCSSCSP